MHGDADIFVSKTNPFPRSNRDNDQASKKSRGQVDRVDFEPPNLSGEYYVGVIGNQDSYIELEVKI